MGIVNHRSAFGFKGLITLLYDNDLRLRVGRLNDRNKGLFIIYLHPPARNDRNRQVAITCCLRAAIILAKSVVDVPSVNNARISRSKDTEGSPASILATLD